MAAVLPSDHGLSTTHRLPPFRGLSPELRHDTPHHPTTDPIDREADLQRIDEALATLETVTQAWFEHQRLKACQPGLLLSLNRLLDLTSLAKGYASALRVIAEP